MRERVNQGPSKPFLAGVRACAFALGVSTYTIHAWIRCGALRGVQRTSRHYTDDRPRKTSRGKWLVDVSSIEELLSRLYNGGEIPLGLRRRLKSLGKPLPGESP